MRKTFNLSPVKATKTAKKARAKDVAQKMNPFSAEDDSQEYLVEIRNTRGDVLWRSPCPDYDYLVKEINHMLKTPYYAIDVFTTGESYKYGGGRVIASPRKIHMATIKYGKAESGPLASKLNESLIFRAESEHQDWPNYEDLIFNDDGCRWSSILLYSRR